MKSLNILFTAPGKVELVEEEVPQLEENWVLCRTERSLISIGTETRCLEGKFEEGSHWAAWVKYPFHPGYDNTAVVLEVGSVGESGMGSYHGREGFMAFSHTKSIVDKKTWLDLKMRYQPYTKGADKLIRMFLR